MRVTADTDDRPGHCATVVRRAERGDKRGEEGREVEDRGEELVGERNKKESRRGGNDKMVKCLFIFIRHHSFFILEKQNLGVLGV